MITNLSSIFPSIVETLTEAPFNFYLTGSRAMGGFNKDSDWDFFVENSKEVIKFLNSIGFEKDNDSVYSDPTVLDVYYGYCEHHGRLVKVDIQLVDNALFKLTVQQLLKKCFPSGMSHFDKYTARVIWKVALEVAKQK